jgi:hypothetical protein
MNKIAAEFWGPQWKGSPIDPVSTAKLLSGFNRRISKSIRKVDVVLAKETIMEAGDTACGPDGIPFSVYKALIDIAAPILTAVYHHAATGNTPTKGTNHSWLYLIPKLDTDLISDSRPINVGNTDVRLLGSLVHKSIYDAIECLISSRQKGFLNGRQILENIQRINGNFHEAIKKGKDYDLFFLDLRNQPRFPDCSTPPHQASPPLHQRYQIPYPRPPGNHNIQGRTSLQNQARERGETGLPPLPSSLYSGHGGAGRCHRQTPH